jgi:Trypsin
VLFQICAGTPAADTCQGDSGGSLVVQHDHKYEIVGVTSWGQGCGRRGFPGVYTRISKYITWICTQLEDYMDNECICQKNTTKTCHTCGQSSLLWDENYEESEEESEETANSSEESSSDGTTGGFWFNLKQIFELFDP